MSMSMGTRQGIHIHAFVKGLSQPSAGVGTKERSCVRKTTPDSALTFFVLQRFSSSKRSHGGSTETLSALYPSVLASCSFTIEHTGLPTYVFARLHHPCPSAYSFVQPASLGIHVFRSLPLLVFAEPTIVRSAWRIAYKAGNKVSIPITIPSPPPTLNRPSFPIQKT